MKKTIFYPFFLFLLPLFPFSPLAAQRITTQRIEVTSALDACPDSAARAIVERYKASVDSVMMPVLGESRQGMSAGRPESLLSNWVADVLVEASVFENGRPADMGLVNMGGLRNNMPKGTVHRGDIILISPFDNRLAIVHLKGTQLLELMRNIAAVRGEGVSRDVRLVITEKGELVSALIGGKPIDPDRTYRVATLDYLAEGNDRMYALKKAERLNVSDLYTRDCMMRSIEKKKVIDAAIEGRITIVSDTETKK